MEKSKLIANTKDSMTCQWDILCSYDESKINHVLAEKFQKQKEHMVTTLSTELETINRLRKTTERYKLTVKLEEPKIQFVPGERNTCQVDMPVGNSICILSEKKDGEEEFHKVGEEVIDANQIIVRAIVPLNATTGDGVYTDAKGNISFTDKNQMSKIYLHFKHSQLTVFKLIPCSKEAEENCIVFNPEIKSEITESLIKAFLEQVDEIQYELGSISNVPQGVNELIPKSFVFDAYKLSETEKGCLNIYIQTENSGFGTGNKTPAFLIDGRTTIPYPSESEGEPGKSFTAALYLKKEVVLDKMIKPNLPSSITASYGDDSEKRLLINFYIDKEITIPKVDKLPGVSNLKSEDTVINFKDAPIQLLFDGDKAKITWKYTFKCKFKGKIGFGMSHMHMSETATVEAVYYDEIDISKLSSEEMHFSFSLKNTDNYKFNISTKTGGFPGLFSSGGDKSYIEQYLDKQLPFDTSDISLDISPIGMFLVANVLIPEKHIFNFSHADGVYRPNDIVLFGNIVDSID